MSTASHTKASTRRARSWSAPLGRAAAMLGLLATLAATHLAHAAPLDEARQLFERFIAAQNAHDAAVVESTLWDSPEFLWVSRGTQVRSRAAAMALYKSYYAGTWQVAPNMEQFHAVALTDNVVQILVPIVFTRGYPGQPPQQAEYLISQAMIRDAGGWHIASILPLADTHLK